MLKQYLPIAQCYGKFLFLLTGVEIDQPFIVSTQSLESVVAPVASSPSILTMKKHDVFLNFRGEDTRNNFVSHLYAALRRKKVATYIDEKSLERGNDIIPTLWKAIEASKISIVIFSKDYGASPWCLDELVQIMECRKKNGQIVLPVFYNIDPSDVEEQKGSFRDAFEKYEECFKDRMDMVQEWRAALTTSANISGFDSQVIRFLL